MYTFTLVQAMGSFISHGEVVVATCRDKARGKWAVVATVSSRANNGIGPQL